jgi:hypothetical protein
VNICSKQQEGHPGLVAKPQVSDSTFQELWEEELDRAQTMEASDQIRPPALGDELCHRDKRLGILDLVSDARLSLVSQISVWFSSPTRYAADSLRSN